MQRAEALLLLVRFWLIGLSCLLSRPNRVILNQHPPLREVLLICHFIIAVRLVIK